MASRPTRLLNVDRNAKTAKGQKKGYLTGILYLAPAKLSGYEVCPQRSAGCTAACLNTAGRGTMTTVQKARTAKTKWYFEDRAGFMAQLVKEIAALVRKAERDGLTPVVRLNGTSDIPWERVRQASTGINIMEAFPHVQFYDYTKITKRALACARGEMPVNYRLVFSLTEDNDTDAREVLNAGGNVAVVFKDKLPGAAFFSREGRITTDTSECATDCQSAVVHDGDETDLRHLDPAGVIVGLKAKGKARKDTSGFVR